MLDLKKVFGPIYKQLPDEFVEHVKQQAAKDPDYLAQAGEFLQEQVEDGKLTKLGRHYVYGEELAEREKTLQPVKEIQQTKTKVPEKKKEDDEFEFL